MIWVHKGTGITMPRVTVSNANCDAVDLWGTMTWLETTNFARRWMMVA